MSSTKFKKDTEIIADYETQVKGAVRVGCLCPRCVCIVSADAGRRLCLTESPFMSMHVFFSFMLYNAAHL